MDWAQVAISGSGWAAAMALLLKLRPERQKISAEAASVQARTIADLAAQNSALYQEVEDLRSELEDATTSAEEQERRYESCAQNLTAATEEISRLRKRIADGAT